MPINSRRALIISKIYKNGETLSSIAKKYGINHSTFSRGLTRWLSKETGSPRGKLGRAIFFTEKLTAIAITPVPGE